MEKCRWRGIVARLLLLRAGVTCRRDIGGCDVNGDTDGQTVGDGVSVGDLLPLSIMYQSEASNTTGHFVTMLITLILRHTPEATVFISIILICQQKKTKSTIF